MDVVNHGCRTGVPAVSFNLLPRTIIQHRPIHDAMVGLVRIELTTSSLSVTRSNRLSYSPYGIPIYTSRTKPLLSDVPELGSD